MTDNVVLEAIGVKSYAEVYEPDAAEVLKRLDAESAPIHPGDAFLAVLVLSAVSDLAETTERLDKARTRLDWAALVLALLAVAVGLGQLAAVITD